MPTVGKKGSPRRPRRKFVAELAALALHDCWFCAQPAEGLIVNTVNEHELALCASCWGSLGIMLKIPQLQKGTP
jgi:hypothetical protein